MFDVSAIGNRIRRRREELGFTLDEVALKVGITKGTISRYENGVIVRPKIPVLESIARALEIDPRELLGWAEEGTSVSRDYVTSRLTPAEELMLSSYRNAPQQVRDIVDVALAPYAPSASAEKAM